MTILTTDNRIDIVDSGETIENATWEQTEAAIRSLDEASRTALTVERPDRFSVLQRHGGGGRPRQHQRESSIRGHGGTPGSVVAVRGFGRRFNGVSFVNRL